MKQGILFKDVERIVKGILNKLHGEVEVIAGHFYRSEERIKWTATSIEFTCTLVLSINSTYLVELKENRYDKIFKGRLLITNVFSTILDMKHLKYCAKVVSPYTLD